MLIISLLTNVFVLVNVILFSRSNGLNDSVFNNTFDELKEVKFFKEIKCLKGLQKAKAYLEPKQASMMDLFCESI